MRGLHAILAAGLLGFAGTLPALGAKPAPVLEVPIYCDMRVDCFVQNYIDTDPGPGARDMTCGPLTYQGHDGIDLRLPGPRQMEMGVAVIAAAPGIVRAVRDGVPDVSIKDPGAAPVAGREAGNAVVIDHGDGWETQYSHMRFQSVIVRPGDTVAAGDRLGLVGLSGMTEFPHLHFSVRHKGVTLDPYTGLPPGSGCDKTGTSLWSAAAQKSMAYRAGGLLVAGFASEVVSIDKVMAGDAEASVLSTTDASLVFWVTSWGLRQGDREHIWLLRPDGSKLSETTSTLPGDKAQWLRYTGRKRAAEPWPSGRYRGGYTVTRTVDGQDTVIVEVTRTIDVRAEGDR